MSFNIRYGTARDGEDAWVNRRSLVMRVVRAFDPAVVGVQEALRFQLVEITDSLPRMGLVGAGRDDGREAGEYSAILYDRERLEVLESGTFWYSEEPSRAGSIAWGANLPRICTWARLRDRRTGAVFRMYNTHFDHESQESRERSAALLLERIAAGTMAEPVLVTGDFNAGEDNAAFRALVSDATVRLRDAFREIHPGADSVGTFNGFRGATDGPKIDAILVSAGWMVVSASIDRTNEGGRYPSDHFPVTAVLRWSR
jgi:endonuclease/exonuclease/phosphatase family metal-dependent hydrolase